MHARVIRLIENGQIHLWYLSHVRNHAQKKEYKMTRTLTLVQVKRTHARTHKHTYTYVNTHVQTKSHSLHGSVRIENVAARNLTTTLGLVIQSSLTIAKLTNKKKKRNVHKKKKNEQRNNYIRKSHRAPLHDIYTHAHINTTRKRKTQQGINTEIKIYRKQAAAAASILRPCSRDANSRISTAL